MRLPRQLQTTIIMVLTAVAVYLLYYAWTQPITWSNVALLVLILFARLLIFEKYKLETAFNSVESLNFTIIIAVFCGIKLFLIYQLTINAFVYFHNQNLRRKGWHKRFLFNTVRPFAAGSLVNILASRYLLPYPIFTLHSLLIFALITFFYVLIIDLLLLLMIATETTISRTQLRETYGPMFIDHLVVKFLYYGVFTVLYVQSGLLAVILYLAVLYYNEYAVKRAQLAEIKSTIDPLTKLYNRRFLDETIQRYKQERLSFAVIMLDIDNFKRINDGYNHLVGDQVLVDFAKVIKRSLREDDFVARYGGEEFCVLLKNVTLENAVMVAERIRHNVENRVVTCNYEGKQVDIKHTTSLGVSLFDRDKQNNPLEEADAYLKIAKRSGKNQVRHVNNVSKEVFK